MFFNKEVVAHIMGKWNGGGVESVVMNYYKHINKDKIQFHFICDSDSTKIPYDLIDSMGGKVILVSPYQKIFSYLFELVKIFKNNNYKIVHSHINTLSVFPLLCAFLARVPIRIAHSHSETSKKEYARNFLKKILKKFSKVFANNYFSCSVQSAKYQFGNNIVNNTKFKLIYNAIEVEKYKFSINDRVAIRKKYNISDETIVIGNIGRIIEQKNQKFLLDMTKKISQKKSVMLFLIGDGPLKNELIKYSEKLNIKDNVKFLCYIDEVQKYYSVFDFFCLPSLYEGFPVVGVEAQANGVHSIFSSEITKDIKISKNAYFLDIRYGTEEWVEYITNNFSERNVENLEILEKYNIKIQASVLEDIYFECIRDI